MVRTPRKASPRARSSRKSKPLTPSEDVAPSREAQRTPLIDVIILTYQEETNLPHTLQSLEGLDCSVHIVDSGSTDRTTSIARSWGANVVTHAFENQARQLNWALDALPLRAPWTLRLDADERLTKELRDELSQKLPSVSAGVAGFLIKRRVYFWGKWMKRGGYYPIWLLRLWRRGHARSEDAWMDEQMIVSDGSIERLNFDFIDENRKGLAFWVDKHNHYADREARMSLEGISSHAKGAVGEEVARRRFLKKTLYGRAPLFVRPVAYWFFRYIIQLGFLDGRAGFVFHFMQALWYRMLIDAKLYEAAQNTAPPPTSRKP